MFRQVFANEKIKIMLFRFYRKDTKSVQTMSIQTPEQVLRNALLNGATLVSGDPTGAGIPTPIPGIGLPASTNCFLLDNSTDFIDVTAAPGSETGKTVPTLGTGNVLLFPFFNVDAKKTIANSLRNFVLVFPPGSNGEQTSIFIDSLSQTKLATTGQSYTCRTSKSATLDAALSSNGFKAVCDAYSDAERAEILNSSPGAAETLIFKTLDSILPPTAVVKVRRSKSGVNQTDNQFVQAISAASKAVTQTGSNPVALFAQINAKDAATYVASLDNAKKAIAQALFQSSATAQGKFGIDPISICKSNDILHLPPITTTSNGQVTLSTVAKLPAELFLVDNLPTSKTLVDFDKETQAQKEKAIQDEKDRQAKLQEEKAQQEKDQQAKAKAEADAAAAAAAEVEQNKLQAKLQEEKDQQAKAKAEANAAAAAAAEVEQSTAENLKKQQELKRQQDELARQQEEARVQQEQVQSKEIQQYYAQQNQRLQQQRNQFEAEQRMLQQQQQTKEQTNVTTTKTNEKPMPSLASIDSSNSSKNTNSTTLNETKQNETIGGFPIWAAVLLSIGLIFILGFIIALITYFIQKRNKTPLQPLETTNIGYSMQQQQQILP